LIMPLYTQRHIDLGYEQPSNKGSNEKQQLESLKV